MHVSSKTLEEVEAAYREYEHEVHASKMKASTKPTYLLHSENFVRLLKGEFTPGRRAE